MTNPNRWKAISYALALFVAGGVIGAVITYRKAEVSPLRVDRKGEIVQHIRQRLQTALDLTPEQAAQFAPLIEKTSEELEASHRDCLKRICDALDAMHRGMEPSLTAPQKEKLKQLEAERRQVMLEKYHYPPQSQPSGSQ